MAPRGSAKTTWATLAHPLRAALHGDERFIILTSDTGDQARAYLGDLREQLEGNEALLRDYPAAAGRGPVWRGDAIRLRNGVEVAAYGTGAESAAARPTAVTGLASSSWTTRRTRITSFPRCCASALGIG